MGKKHASQYANFGSLPTVFEYNEIKMKLADALSQQFQAKYTYLLKDRILAFYSYFTLTD